jgi:hypothetical protein
VLDRSGFENRTMARMASFGYIEGSTTDPLTLLVGNLSPLEFERSGPPNLVSSSYVHEPRSPASVRSWSLQAPRFVLNGCHNEKGGWSDSLSRESNQASGPIPRKRIAREKSEGVFPIGTPADAQLLF